MSSWRRPESINPLPEILRFAQNDRGRVDSRSRIKYGTSFAGMMVKKGLLAMTVGKWRIIWDN
jgi:hypothetical protein